jgi:[ribosomal protein S18]-alanine N-acetyltransferase
VIVADQAHRPDAVEARDATTADLEIVVDWITSKRECELWAGPGISFPLEPLGLAAQIDMRDATNVALDDEHGLAAFGQVLPRSHRRAHLARVIVRPDARGCGIGRALVQALLSRAGEAGLSSATLNVYRENTAAATLYAGLGFRRAERPQCDPASLGAWFMQRRIDLPAGHL